LEEAVEVMRQLWEGGIVRHHGRYYTVENARIYDRPEVPPPVLVSALGPKAARCAGRIGDGLVTISPEPAILDAFDEAGGQDRPRIGAMKACWGTDVEQCRKLATELWANELLPPEIGRELPMPAHYRDLASLVTEEQVAEEMPCGPDPEPYLAKIASFRDAGFETLGIQQIGSDQAGFFDFYRKEIEPKL
jgi:G6PDH family F420-dependent oxidoreductase